MATVSTNCGLVIPEATRFIVDRDLMVYISHDISGIFNSNDKTKEDLSNLPSHRKAGLKVKMRMQVSTFSTYCHFLVIVPGGPDGKESACNAGDPGLNHGLERFPLRRKWPPTHSSILAWRIPWSEEPGERKSMGSQRVGHD